MDLVMDFYRSTAHQFKNIMVIMDILLDNNMPSDGPKFHSSNDGNNRTVSELR